MDNNVSINLGILFSGDKIFSKRFGICKKDLLELYSYDNDVRKNSKVNIKK